MPKNQPPKLPDIYFDLRTGGFLMELVPGRFVTQTENHIRTHLQRAGHEMSKGDYADNGVRAFDDFLARAQVKNYIDYAGPLAGYKAGLYELPGQKRALVTESCKPVEPGKSKKMPHTEKFLSELVGSQHPWVLSWLKVGWESLASGNFMPGQLLALCGPGGCGKTFFQWIVTQLFGGRSAKPYRYMTGQTQFNADLAQAEHLPMGDVAASYDIRARKNFASQIKEFCVEPEMSIHGKGKDATLAMTTFRRLTLSVNNEPEHMMIIPPMDADMLPKIMLIKCSPARLNENRETNQRVFRSELPALAAFLRDWKIPKNIADGRFGVAAHHDKELLRIVSESAPEVQLLTILDEVLWDQKSTTDCEWRGSAESLKVRLINSPHAATIYRLLDWPSACGTYLARLKQKIPARFEQRFTKGKSSWIIRKET